jgi:hypothetical protein
LGRDSTSPLAASTLIASRTTVRLARRWESAGSSSRADGAVHDAAPMAWTIWPWSPPRG